MKKITKKTSKAFHKKAKDLGVNPAKGRTIRGGLTVTKTTDCNSTKLLHEA